VSHIDHTGRASAPPQQQQQQQQGGGRPGVASPPVQQQPPQQQQQQQQQQQRPPGGGQGGGGQKAPLAHPDGKTMGQGPATFEEMGIPQGKSEGDCVSTLFFLFFFPLFTPYFLVGVLFVCWGGLC
jgi:hypothetical protein